MIDYDSFSRCHLTDIFFRHSHGSKRVKKFSISQMKNNSGHILADFFHAFTVRQRTIANNPKLLYKNVKQFEQQQIKQEISCEM